MDFVVEDVFAQIIRGELPADIVYDEATVMAFKDINPKANFHVLVVPKGEGFKTGMDVTPDNKETFGRLILVARYVSDLEDLDTYKLHMNVGPAGGQVVPRVHLHMLSDDFPTSLPCCLPTNEVLFEDDQVLAFAHANPACEHHVILQLKDTELVTGFDVREVNTETFGDLFLAAKKIAEQLGLPGYKLFMDVTSSPKENPQACLHMLSPDFQTEL